ncbi:A/G-specific adenine glycosylase [Thiovibrio sp. JS02]
MQPEAAAALQEALLAWFSENGRDLPWRRRYLPYHIWLSEIMLQQTQMERVVVYFRRWLETFPDIASLAAADEQEVLRLWEGLGYYSRARNLLKTAALIHREHGGRLPEDHAALLRLPGIGRYTAGAIMSLAFNRHYPLVDANVERLFARLFNLDRPVKEKDIQASIWQLAEALIPRGKARWFNQGLMELGALICRPRAPKCGECPLRPHCLAFRLRLVEKRPVPGKAREIIPIHMVTGVLIHRGRIFIQKRLADDVWPNLWEFPGGALEEGESPEEALAREYLEETGFAIRATEKITIIKHSYTRYRITLHCYYCSLAGNAGAPVLSAAQESRWVRPGELADFAFPSPHRRLIDGLAEENPG